VSERSHILDVTLHYINETLCPGELVRATSWTAVVARGAGVNDSTVQVETNARTGLDVFVDREKQDFEDVATQEFNGKTIEPIYK